jgi:hypothetical protein
MKLTEALISGPCPFCHRKGGHVTADFDGTSNDAAQPMLLHTLPYCREFSEMSGDEFVQAVIDRKHLQ